MLYTALQVPLVLVFPQTQWLREQVAEAIIDLLFVVDVLVSFRTTYNDRGHRVLDGRKVRRVGA